MTNLKNVDELMSENRCVMSGTLSKAAKQIKFFKLKIVQTWRVVFKHMSKGFRIPFLDPKATIHLLHGCRCTDLMDNLSVGVRPNLVNPGHFPAR